MQLVHQNTNRKHFMIWICCPLIVVSIFIAGYLILHHDPYASYDEYRKQGKNFGSVKHYTIDNEAYYLSMFYPESDDGKLNAILQEYREKHIKKSRLKEKYVIYIDYDSSILYDRFVSITFHQKIIDSDDKTVKTITNRTSYDLQQKEQIVLDTMFRSDYMNMLQKQAALQGIAASQITRESLDQFEIHDNGIRFFLKNDKELMIRFEDEKRYIRLVHSRIPSLYQGDIITPPKESVDPTKPMVALTFDDGPHPQNTEEIINILNHYDAKATFFMLGKNVINYPDVVKNVYAEGHELGNHSWDHSMNIAAIPSKPMDATGVWHEINDTDDAIYQICGSDPKSFRPPYGALNDTLRNTSHLNFTMWNLDTRDWDHHDPSIVYQEVDEQVHDGSLILMHDIHGSTKDSIDRIASSLQKKGYQMVTVSTLMKYRQDEMIRQHVVEIVPANKP